MVIVQTIMTFIVLGILYKRMVQREIPQPIEKRQAVFPVLLGLASVVVYVLLIYWLDIFSAIAQMLPVHFTPLFNDICSAIFVAAFPEEAAKLAMMLLAFWMFREKIKNVYEYVLIGAAVGFGFTLFEEFCYGFDQDITTLGRLFTVAAHMIFGMIMAKHLGLARYQKASELENGDAEYIKAILTPFFLHASFDALVDNPFINNEDDFAVLFLGLLLAVAATIALFVLQIEVLSEFKKDTEKYCQMTFLSETSTKKSKI